MNRLEAKQLLGRMTAASPKQELSAPTAEVWIEHLIPKRADLAAECVRQLEHASKWFPSVSEFTVEYETKAEYERIANADGKGLPVPAPMKASPEFVREIVAEMKETIQRGKAKQEERELQQRGRVNRVLEETEVV